MLNSTLLIILRTFREEEIRRFDDFVRSPYFNKNTNVIKLYAIVKKYFPDLKSEYLNREKIWKELFQEKSFNYGIMKNLIYELQKLIEKFLSYSVYEIYGSDQKRNLLENLISKGLDRHFEKNLKTFKSELGKLPDNADNFYYKYLTEAKEQNYLSLRYKTTEAGFCNPAKMNDNLISFFFVNFFTDNYNTLHDSLLYNKKYNMEILESVFEFFNKSPARENEFVLMNYYTLKTLTDLNDNSSFNELKTLLQKNYKKFKHETVYNFSMALINFCNFNIMKGKAGYIKEQFVLYKFIIENGYYSSLSKNFINPNLYANAVSMAGNLNEFEWAENFISDFKHKLHPLQRDSYFALANVSLNIKKKKFDKALSYLSQFKCTNVIDKITQKRFQIIIYYESGFINELYSLIDTSKHFISYDKKVTESAKSIFEKFLNFTLKLSHVKTRKQNDKYDKYYLESLINEILASDVSNKIWLLEKAEELNI
ncbi:MAG: hypothetical protein JSS91_14325 [Bacteroidetes bacterium]|nr:hypothetical protein [Bacteroidota bacterium]